MVDQHPEYLLERWHFIDLFQNNFSCTAVLSIALNFVGYFVYYMVHLEKNYTQNCFKIFYSTENLPFLMLGQLVQ